MFKTALLEIYVRSQPYGGSDKSSNGHRYDSIPFANGMITAGMSCQLLHYQHEEHDVFFKVCKGFDALIVRCNPGQINADGGSQAKFDDAVRELQKEGIQAWPSPDVMEFMGAKDALTKIATLNIGLEDTLTYYEDAAFIEGFKKTMAYQPRVIKQNRGWAEARRYHPQKAEGGRNLRRWRYGVDLHLLRPGGGEVREFDEQLLDEGYR